MPQALQNLRIAVTEHRYTAQLVQLLEREGATVTACPLVKETPVEDADGARRFLALCETTQVDYIVFYTGVGVDFLFRANCRPETIQKSKVLARGPKAVAALKRAGVHIDLVAGLPTTEGIVATLSHEDLVGKFVLVQSYGRENPELADALERRGARVTSISLYRYTEASDRAAVNALIDGILDGAIDAITFTSAAQLQFLLDAAASRQLQGELERRLRQDVLIVAIGDVTARALAQAGLPPQVTPLEPKMGPMVQALATYVEQRRNECSTHFFSS